MADATTGEHDDVGERGEETSSSPAFSDPLVQYILLRKDLEWPTGAVVSQACHGETK